MQVLKTSISPRDFFRNNNNYYRFSSGIATAEHAKMLLTGMPVTCTVHLTVRNTVYEHCKLKVETIMVHCITGRNKTKNNNKVQTSNRCTCTCTWTPTQSQGKNIFCSVCLKLG